ncbi:MAG: hypothetical protein CBB96_07590 [Gammaproteobacteria bacterium TMED36]|nr:MAG: hypothetical protein CBB96_07590 [Gammaproteobacteria bacterium TMED36]
MANGKVRRNQTFNNVLKSINQYMGGQTQESQNRTRQLVQEIEELRKMKPKGDEYKVIGKNLVLIPGEGGGKPSIVDFGITPPVENPEEGYKSTINAILGQPSENESDNKKQFRTDFDTALNKEMIMPEDEYEVFKGKAEDLMAPPEVAKTKYSPVNKVVNEKGEVVFARLNLDTNKWEQTEDGATPIVPREKFQGRIDSYNRTIESYNKAKEKLDYLKQNSPNSPQYQSAKQDFDTVFKDVDMVVQARDRLVIEMAKESGDLGIFNQYKVSNLNSESR